VTAPIRSVLSYATALHEAVPVVLSRTPIKPNLLGQKG
jgi:hypothetical protein